MIESILLGILIVVMLGLLLWVKEIAGIVRVVVPRGFSVDDVTKYKCSVCGGLHTSKEYSGVMIDLDLTGAAARKCIICGTINIGNREFLHYINGFNNIDWVESIILNKATTLISDANVKYALDDATLHSMFQWLAILKGETLDQYSDSVVKRAKLVSDSCISSRIEYTVAQDFSDTFLKDVKSRRDIFYSKHKEIMAEINGSEG
jgi:hypothetical protein